MPTIEEILRAAKEAGASDVHLTVGIPPKMRVNGNLITMDYPKMLPADTLEVLVNIMTEVQRERFEERGEYDMSFSIPNCGRYRVNAYKQRGSVALAFRLVGTKVPSPEELGVPESVIDLYQRKRGLVLVTGPTGSGKSTLVDLIARFYDATSGVITLDGQNVQTYSRQELREKIGVVPQKAALFQGTIRDNLSWGREDATDEEMWEALTTAQAREIVEKKDGQLDFRLEQNGRNLSGGQRQRLTIARALVKKPEILILDDSASALDYATDAKLRAAIRTLEDKTTTFIVSQRASTIRHADKIIVLDDGEIAGMGTHDELLKDCTVYQEIYYSQYPEQRGGVR